jgi:hypothetical protein
MKKVFNVSCISKLMRIGGFICQKIIIHEIKNKKARRV